MQVSLTAPLGLPAGVYGARSYVTSTLNGHKLNVEFDPDVDPTDCEHPITVGAANLL